MVVALLPIISAEDETQLCDCFFIVAEMEAVDHPNACLPYPCYSFIVEDSSCELQVVSHTHIERPLCAVITDPARWTSSAFELSTAAVYYIISPERTTASCDEYDTTYLSARLFK